jgi:hypothetical protein
MKYTIQVFHDEDADWVHIETVKDPSSQQIFEALAESYPDYSTCTAIGALFAGHIEPLGYICL